MACSTFWIATLARNDGWELNTKLEGDLSQAQDDSNFGFFWILEQMAGIEADLEIVSRCDELDDFG